MKMARAAGLRGRAAESAVRSSGREGPKYNNRKAGRVIGGAARAARMRPGVVRAQSRAAGKAGLRGAAKLSAAMSSGRGGGTGVGSKG